MFRSIIYKSFKYALYELYRQATQQYHPTCTEDRGRLIVITHHRQSILKAESGRGRTSRALLILLAARLSGVTITCAGARLTLHILSHGHN